MNVSTPAGGAASETIPHPRYATQQRLPQVGTAGQTRLMNARVLVIGAGGLSCALLPLLAGAGVGQLRIVDPDRVEEGNLHRQTLYRGTDIGSPKAIVAAEALNALNPHIQICPEVRALDPANAPAWIAEADVVVDAADQFAVSYALSDACRVASKSLVSGSAQGLQGYAGIFCGNAPSYRAVFPHWPRSATDCASAGVLGPSVALVGCLQAQLVMNLLLALSPNPCGRLLRWDAQRFAFTEFDFNGAREPSSYWPLIAQSQVTTDDVAIDLRSRKEAPHSFASQVIRRELNAFDRLIPMLPTDRRIVLACRSGLRAVRAAERLQAAGFEHLALLALGSKEAESGR